MEPGTTSIATSTVAMFGEQEMTATFVYDINQPASIKVTFTISIELDTGAVATQSSTWEFARVLVEQAFAVPETMSGQGDVRIFYHPTRGVLSIGLVDAFNVVHEILLDAGPVQHFMSQAIRLLPHGSEHYDAEVDEAIEVLLDGSVS